MIETIVKSWLEEQLALPVSAAVPEHPPDQFVVIEKTGGGYANRLASATLAVQSYAATTLQAARLNQRVKAVMHRLPQLPQICAAKLNSDYNYPDTARKRPRYQAVYDLTYYEDVSNQDTGKEVPHV